MTENIKAEALALAPAMQDIFYTLHAAPELGRCEHHTAEYIRARLTALGIEHTPLAETGTLAVIHGRGPGRVIGFRADIDALPITEETGLPYASRTPGVMHACGHDFHTASLLGAAELFQRHWEDFNGTIKLFFQPDEEGDGGAARMIAAGGMENPHVDAMLCCHVESGIPAGTLTVRSGPVCAASNPFTVTLLGKGTHGAKPHLGTDVIVAGAQVVTALQTIASRRTSPAEPVVVTVGTFHSGTAGNVMPEKAVLTGILRTMGGAARERVKDDFRSVVMGIAAGMGVGAEIEIFESYPGCRNDPGITGLLRTAAAKILGNANVLELPEPSMGTDDFGYFSDTVPGCYYYIGVGNAEKGFTCPNHNPRFAADPDALPLSAAVEVQAALDYLEA
ncbi:MAG: amidohydrolase [Oscillospiraceae bacterium]|nr:amidohydrolase [Oscillospiraceae bacterium]